MSVKQLDLCPICKHRTLRPHCKAATCPEWMRCGNRDCDALLDMRKRRGHAVDRSEPHKRRNVTFAA